MYQGLTYELEEVMQEAIDTGLFVSLCTIEQPPATVGPSGAIDPTAAWPDVAGLIDIPCMYEPIKSSERKSLEEILAVNMRHVLLDGYYPTIVARWRAVIDGVTFDILGAEADSQSKMTRMDVQVVAL